MREILFRGKRIDNGEWVMGDYEHFNLPDGELVVYISSWGKSTNRVNSNTVGQYTGLTDKNGIKIFEGDIVKIHYGGDIWGDNREVVFEEGQWFFKDNTLPQKSYVGAWSNSVVEVVGNIHDTPELMESEAE